MNILYAIDFDDTLNRTQKIDGQDYNPIYDVVDFCKSKKFVILTARRYSPSNLKYIQGFLDSVSLPVLSKEDIYFTNNPESKGVFMEQFLKTYGAKKVILIDDNETARSSVVKSNLNVNTEENQSILEAYHPNDIGLIGNRLGKIARIFSIATKRKIPLFFKQNRDYINKANDEYKNYEHEFKNELNNNILLNVEKGIKNKDKIKYYYLKITMEGPDSIMENEITEQEAIELSKSLNSILGEN